MHHVQHKQHGHGFFRNVRMARPAPPSGGKSSAPQGQRFQGREQGRDQGREQGRDQGFGQGRDQGFGQGREQGRDAEPKGAYMVGRHSDKDLEMLKKAERYRAQGYPIKQYNYTSDMVEVYYEVHKIEKDQLKDDWVLEKRNKFIAGAKSLEGAVALLPIPVEIPNLGAKTEEFLTKKNFFLEKQFELSPPQQYKYSDRELYMSFGLFLLASMKEKEPDPNFKPHRGGFRKGLAGSGIGTVAAMAKAVGSEVGANKSFWGVLFNLAKNFIGGNKFGDDGGEKGEREPVISLGPPGVTSNSPNVVLDTPPSPSSGGVERSNGGNHGEIKRGGGGGGGNGMFSSDALNSILKPLPSFKIVLPTQTSTTPPTTTPQPTTTPPTLTTTEPISRPRVRGGLMEPPPMDDTPIRPKSGPTGRVLGDLS